MTFAVAEPVQLYIYNHAVALWMRKSVGWQCDPPFLSWMDWHEIYKDIHSSQLMGLTDLIDSAHCLIDPPIHKRKVLPHRGTKSTLVYRAVVPAGVVIMTGAKHKEPVKRQKVNSDCFKELLC